MTTHAYQETYLNKAQAALGDAFDYAINTCHIPDEDFIKFFTASSVSKRMENGEPAILAGKSGIESVVFRKKLSRHLQGSLLRRSGEHVPYASRSRHHEIRGHRR